MPSAGDTISELQTANDAAGTANLGCHITDAEHQQRLDAYRRLTPSTETRHLQTMLANYRFPESVPTGDESRVQGNAVVANAQSAWSRLWGGLRRVITPGCCSGSTVVENAHQAGDAWHAPPLPALQAVVGEPSGGSLDFGILLGGVVENRVEVMPPPTGPHGNNSQGMGQQRAWLLHPNIVNATTQTVAQPSSSSHLNFMHGQQPQGRGRT